MDLAAPPPQPTTTSAASADRRWPRWARPVLGAVLLALYLVWAGTVWQHEHRAVSAASLRADLHEGGIQAFVISPEVRSHRAWPPDPLGSMDSFDTHPERGGITVYRTASGQVRYVVGLPEVRPHTAARGGGYLLPESTPLSEQLVDELRAAGVPLRGWVVDDRSDLLGLLLVALALLAVVAGPAPQRGNRWFWFWLLFLPLGLGVAAYAAFELARPPRHPRAADRRFRSGPGFLVLLAAALATSLSVDALRALLGTLLIPG